MNSNLRTKGALSRAVFGLLVLLPGIAYAEVKGDMHLLSIGAGIASPSDTSALIENPAGLIYNSGVKLLFTGANGGNSLSNSTVGAGVFLGNATVGGAIKMDTVPSVSGSSVLTAGIAVDIKAIHSTLGASCAASLSSGVGVNCSRFGLIYDATGPTRVGVSLLSGSPTLIGVGVASDIASAVAVALDASLATSGSNSALKPGLEFNVAPVQFAIGYGFTQNSGNALIGSGLSLGLGALLGKRIHLQAYYGQLAQYFVGIAVVF